MDAQTFKQEYGIEESEAVAVAAGTNYAYFHQIATGHRRPSIELAEALVAASGGRLDLVALLKSKKTAA
ncbi:MAG: hypothetical protein Hals2KO_21310 [Halioglobus sp.]